MSTFIATSNANDKAKIKRVLKRLVTFILAINEYQKDKTNLINRFKVTKMLRELTEIRYHAEFDI